MENLHFWYCAEQEDLRERDDEDGKKQQQLLFLAGTSAHTLLLQLAFSLCCSVLACNSHRIGCASYCFRNSFHPAYVAVFSSTSRIWISLPYELDDTKYCPCPARQVFHFELFNIWARNSGTVSLCKNT